MDNKLSELSKPVAWEVKGILCHSEEEARVYVGEPDPLYSQEYVSALDDVAQYWIGQSAEWKERAEAAEAKLATPIRIVNYDEFFICHVSGASDDYCKGWVDGRNAAARDVGKAGFTVEGDGQ
ncbi:Uncharacterised protein [Serratia ficaria]|uniref:hypothetical protein n=1 Tax=Serratia ficaria TaxID=61651 RepID=UPI00217C367B|nr:hypothetical protein [Serratia ficaria]CAI1024248.1 Uncharacterised protein [Serratia ficaria]CAI1859303.1 Uncharacterised protein [Serratia ficaria]CAI2472151.1 Uncharacterised protein [Serratia ficaria]